MVAVVHCIYCIDIFSAKARKIITEKDIYVSVPIHEVIFYRSVDTNAINGEKNSKCLN